MAKSTNKITFTKLQKIPMTRNLSYKIIAKGIKQISIFKLKLCPNILNGIGAQYRCTEQTP